MTKPVCLRFTETTIPHNYSPMGMNVEGWVDVVSLLPTLQNEKNVSELSKWINDANAYERTMMVEGYHHAVQDLHLDDPDQITKKGVLHAVMEGVGFIRKQRGTSMKSVHPWAFQLARNVGMFDVDVLKIVVNGDGEPIRITYLNHSDRFAYMSDARNAHDIKTEVTFRREADGAADGQDLWVYVDPDEEESEV